MNLSDLLLYRLTCAPNYRQKRILALFWVIFFNELLVVFIDKEKLVSQFFVVFWPIALHQLMSYDSRHF
jgi:hypothetical protein